jgi:CheY-like chemotaxis protein
MPKRILLADDSITIQKVVELTFSDGDYEITTANNGARALQKLAENTPDVILSDIIMPEKNGYELCEFVKSHPEYRHIPVILLTGTFEPFDPDRAEKAGCDAVVTKPFESQALISKVEELIERRRRSDDERRSRATMQPAQTAFAPAPASPEAPEGWQIPTFTSFPAEAPPPPVETLSTEPADEPFSAGWSEQPTEPEPDEPFATFTEAPSESSMEESVEPPHQMETEPAFPSAVTPPNVDHEAETRAFPLVPAGFTPESDFQGDVAEPLPQEEPDAFSAEENEPPEVFAAAQEDATEEDEPSEVFAGAQEDAREEENEPSQAFAAAQDYAGDEPSSDVFAAAQEQAVEEPGGRTLQFPSAGPWQETSEETPAEAEPIAPEPFISGWQPEDEAQRPEPVQTEALPSEGEETEESPSAFEEPSLVEPEPAPFFAAGGNGGAPDEVFTSEEDETDEYLGRPDEPVYELASSFASPEGEPQQDQPFAEAEAPADEAAAFAMPEPIDVGGPAPEAPELSSEATESLAASALAVAPLSDADVDRIARRVVELMSDQLVRNIAWEVIPDVAQAVVRERVRELEQA